MFDRLMEIVLGQRMYFISGVLLVIFGLFSLISREFYKGIKIILWLAVLVWAGSVGYEYITGSSIVSFFDKNTESSIDPEKEQGAFRKYYSTHAIDEVK